MEENDLQRTKYPYVAWMHRYNGGVPEDQYRCQQIRKTGDRCQNFRLKGVKYCRYHRGRAHQKNKQRKQQQILSNVPAFYQKYLSKSLQQALDDYMLGPPDEQLQILTELAMMRESSGLVFAMFSAVRDKREQHYDTMSDKDKAILDETTIRVGALVKDALMDIARIAKLASSINAEGRDKISLMQLKFFTDQMTVCAHEAASKAFAGEPAKAEQFARDFNNLVQNSVKLPTVDGGTGEPVTKKPSDDVNLMDDTVPRVADDPDPTE